MYKRIPKSIKIILHYDTKMSRSRIGGERFSLIVNAIDGNPSLIRSAFN